MSPKPKANKDFSLADIMAKLCGIEKYSENQNKILDDLRLTLEEIKQKQFKLQEDLDSLVETSKDHDRDLKIVEKKLEGNSLDITNIYDTIDSMNYKLNAISQEKLNKNLIINGIPKEQKEDIKQVISGIFTNMGMNLDNDDIEDSYRVHDRNLSPPVIVKLKKKCIKEMILKQRKQTNKEGQTKWKSMYAKDFGFNSGNQIYINEELTQQTRILFNAAKQQLKEKTNYKFIWVTEGKILAKEDENSKVQIIRSNRDILEITKTFNDK